MPTKKKILQINKLMPRVSGHNGYGWDNSEIVFGDPFTHAEKRAKARQCLDNYNKRKKHEREEIQRLSQA